MENFEFNIVNFKDVSSGEIEYYYSRLFAISVIKMLQKLGIGEKEIYVMPDRKKKLRHIYEKTLGICYHSRPASKVDEMYEGVEFNGCYYQIEWFYKTDYNSLPNRDGFFENSGYLQIGNMKEWSEYYNYLRIELSIPKGKRKVIKASYEEDLSKYM